MNSSVKFFDPTVIWTLALSGFFSIRPAPVVVDDSLLSPPHAAMPIARTAAANRANSALRPVFVLISGGLLPIARNPRPAGSRGILCASARPLQLQAPRSDQTLYAREDQLDHEREQRDEDRSGEHTVVA